MIVAMGPKDSARSELVELTLARFSNETASVYFLLTYKRSEYGVVYQ